MVGEGTLGKVGSRSPAIIPGNAGSKGWWVHLGLLPAPQNVKEREHNRGQGGRAGARAQEQAEVL